MNGNKSSGALNDVRSISSVLHEMKDETRHFVQTRLKLLKSELQEKIPDLKIAAMMGAAGALLVVTAYLLLVLAVVAAVAVAFRNSQFQWVFAFAAVGLLWCLLGGVALYFAKREFAVKGIMPKRTFEILKGDKLWLESEAKNEYERAG